MKKVFFVWCCLWSFLLFSCSSADKNPKSAKESYEATKSKLVQKEKDHPTNFLDVHGRSRKNLLGQTVVKGDISNSASFTTYKDVEVQLTFFSKTNTLLETDKETIYIEVPPGQERNFKTKYFAPKGTDSVGVNVLSAMPLAVK